MKIRPLLASSLAQDVYDIGQSLRLSQPTGWILLVLPCLWSHIVAFQGLRGREIFILTASAFWARSLGCLYNDWIDRPFDRCVRRTSHRPLALRPPSKLMKAFGLTFLVLPALILISQFPWHLCLLAGLGTALYPFLKRWIHAPQVFLGLIFNLGVFAALARSPHDFSQLSETTWKSLTPFLLLYLSGVLWTIEYDTIYAYQDYEDDQRLHLGSLALWVGLNQGYPFLFGLQTVRYLLLAGLTPSLPILGALVLIFGVSLGRRVHLNLYCPSSCQRDFQRAPIEGMLIAGWILWQVKTGGAG